MRTPNLSQKPVRLALAGAIGLSVVAGGAAIADAATGTVRTSAASLTVRSGPGTGYAAVTTLKKGTKVNISCQTTARRSRAPTAPRTSGTRSAPAATSPTPTSTPARDGFVAPKCGGTTTPPSGAIKDDYPYRGATSGVDQWNFYKGQCTSFAAWRVNHNLGVSFSNSYKGQHWGNAEPLGQRGPRRRHPGPASPRR